MKDINGGEISEGGMAMLACHVMEIDEAGIRVRVMNSDQELLVGFRHDELFDGLVADSELIAFDESIAPAMAHPDDQADGVKAFALDHLAHSNC